MTIDIALHNETLARALVAELIKSGVRHFCISPGSRSTALTLAAAEHPLSICSVHFDERTSGFFALGIAKAKKVPVALICTSGSALANYMPAIVEASLDHIPLIILAADRPFELRDIGANQTMDQTKCFNTYLRWQSDLPLSDPLISEKMVNSLAGHAVFRSTTSPKGPVMINTMIREPFFTASPEPLKTESPTPQTRYFHTHAQVSQSDLTLITQEVLRYEKGLIIAGGMKSSEQMEAIFALGMKLQWPIIADPLSSLRSVGRDSASIAFYNHILETTFAKESMIPDMVISLGKQSISKSVMQWMQKSPIKTLLHVGDFPERSDPNYQVTDRISMDPAHFALQLNSNLTARPASIWLSLWKEYSLNIEEQICTFFEEDKSLSPFWVFHHLSQLESEDLAYFFATSLPIRYADSLFFPKSKHIASFSTRGASGIDGTMATACGIAHGLEKRTIAIVGDLSFLYGLNALALLKENSAPVTIILLNNGGGALFEHLPISEKTEIFDRYVKSAHLLNAKSFAEGFGLPYHTPRSREEFIEALTADQSSSIIEITSHSREEYEQYMKLHNFLKKQMMQKRKEKELRYRSQKKES